MCTSIQQKAKEIGGVAPDLSGGRGPHAVPASSSAEVFTVIRRIPGFLGVGMCWVLVASACFVEAATVTIWPAADTTLEEDFPDNNFGCCGTFTAGGRRRGGRTRALVRFDLATNVPSGVIITSATVTVTVVRTPAGAVSSVFSLHYLLASWGEGGGSDHGGTVGAAGEATWNNRLGAGTPWLVSGGDFVSTASASRSIAGNSAYVFNSTTELVSDVQRWIDDPASNFGWLLRSESETTPTTIRRFGSRLDSANTPTLLVGYFRPLRIERPRITNGEFEFEFRAIGGSAYVVERQDHFETGSWRSVTNIPPPGADTDVQVINLLSNSNAFYRVRKL